MRGKLNVELRGLIDETLVTCQEIFVDDLENFNRVYFKEVHDGVLDLAREFGLEELTLKQVKQAELSASGHSDYVKTFAVNLERQMRGLPMFL